MHRHVWRQPAQRGRVGAPELGGSVVKHQMFPAPPRAPRRGAKRCLFAPQLRSFWLQHILQPNKITQLSNLKTKSSSKKTIREIEWKPLIASLLVSPSLEYTMWETAGLPSAAYITFCRVRWIRRAIHRTLSTRERSPDSFTASLNGGADAAWPVLVSPGVTLCQAAPLADAVTSLPATTARRGEPCIIPDTSVHLQTKALKTRRQWFCVNDSAGGPAS